MSEYTESSYENAVMQFFEERLGYERIYGPDVERDYHSPLFEERLLPALRRVNPDMPADALEEAVRKLKDPGSGTLVQRNMLFMGWLQNGIEVNYQKDGENRSGIVCLIDYENPERNDFVAANQWTFVEKSEKRPDMVLFVNGMPLAIAELKSPSREDADTSEAYAQLQTYMAEIPSFFVYNAILAISDQFLSKAGTITSPESRFMEWKTKDGRWEEKQLGRFDVFFEGIFGKARFLDIVQNFICFNQESDEYKTFKILAAYHQYFAVRKAVESTAKATETDGRAGVFWHTQGSGKSLSMVFYARLLQTALKSPTIIVVTDRNDLDDQLYGQFSRCRDFLRQTPEQAVSRADLQRKLKGREANGIFFTTMQKFEEVGEPLSGRRNIVVMADEAHRGHYGLGEKVDSKTGRIRIGEARLIRDALPNASFIGFTGTPISLKDRNTVDVFGEYIDVYDMTQAVEDGATVPVYYESRVMKLKLDQDVLALIDKEYEDMAENADPAVIEKSKQQLGRMEVLLGADKTIDSLVRDILEHYENNRADEQVGKAMIVAYSRAIAMKIYDKILELRPGWEDKVGVVMTGDNADPEKWRKVIGDKAHKQEMARRFKNSGDPLKIVIVVDMWLTGFDVPALSTMYVFKPMAGHNLMQAIARVNRVFRDKAGGLVVDYIGIAAALKQAMADYTGRDRENYGDTDVATTALPKFMEKLEVCRDLFHSFDYSGFISAGGDDYVRARLISGGANFILGKGQDEAAAALPEDKRTPAVFVREAALLKDALSLCSALVERPLRVEAAFFEACRVLLVKLTNAGTGTRLSLPEVNERISELLKQTVKSDGVVNLFSSAGTGFSLFDEAFLEQISKLPEKNIAVEILRRLLADQVKVFRRTNVVKAKLFSEILQQTMNSYVNGMLTNEEVIQKLLEMAQEIVNAGSEAGQNGLSEEELAFYDALTKPEAIRDFYTHEALLALSRELTDVLRKNRTIDWTKKESARANMRRMVKRLLKIHKYPPEGMEEAMQTVMEQCELWVDNAA